jgi:hypothetical protein
MSKAIVAGAIWFGLLGTAMPTAAGDEPPVCQNHGTAVDFLSTPKEAAAQAKKEQKLVFVLHVSGLFETPEFT